MTEQTTNLIVALAIFTSFVGLCALSAYFETRYHERNRRNRK